MKKKLKILFLAPGGSSHSYKWINSFSKKHDISWFYIDPLKFHISKIKFYNLNNYSYKLFLPIIFFFKVFLLKPDIIHVHSISKNLFISFLAVIFFKKKIILHPWGSDVIFSNFFVRILQFFITNNIIFTDSHIIRKKFLKKNKVFKINFGVDIEYFKKKNLSILSKKKN